MNRISRISILIITFVVAVGLMVAPTEVSAASKYPTKVTGVKASATAFDTVKVSWSKKSNVTGYKIYRSVKKNSGYKLVKTIKSSKTKTWKNTGLKTNKTYYYKIKAYKKVKGKTYNSKKYSVVKSAKPVLNKPGNFKIASNEYKKVKLLWTKGKNAKGYKVYRSTKKSSGYKLMKTTSGTSWTDTSVVANKTYYYKVKSYNVRNGKYQYSAFTGYKYVKAKSAPVIEEEPDIPDEPETPVIPDEPDEPVTPDEPTEPENPYTTFHEKKDCYLQYGSAKIWIGQTWNDTVNASLNAAAGGSGAVSCTSKRTMDGETILVYCYDTVDYDEFLMVYVNGNKVVGWMTNRREAGNFEGTKILTNEPGEKYFSLGDTDGYYLCVSAYNEASTNEATEYYNEEIAIGDTILAGIKFVDKCTGIRTSIKQEEKVAMHVINALRASHDIPALKYNSTLYGTEDGVGTLAYAKTMAMSNACSHYGKDLTAGPLAGTDFEERRLLLGDVTSDTLVTVCENAGKNHSTGEILAWSWYKSVGHKRALLMNVSGLQNYAPPIYMAVAGYEYNGNVFWAFHAGSELKSESNMNDADKPTDYGVCTCEAQKRAIQLIWEEISGINEYEVWRATERNGEYECLTVGLMSPNWYDSGLTPGQTYYYRIVDAKTSNVIHTAWATVPALTHDTISEHNWQPVCEANIDFDTAYISGFATCNNCNYTTDSTDNLYAHIDDNPFDDCGAYSSGGSFTLYKRTDTNEYIENYSCSCGETRYVDVDSFLSELE